MIAWLLVEHRDDKNEVIGPFPSLFHAQDWASKWLAGAEAVEGQMPEGYHYSVKETEAYLRSRV